MLTVVQQITQLIKLELNTGQDIVMPSVLQFLSLLARLLQANGVISELAVLNLIYGRPTNKLTFTLLIHVLLQVITSARVIHSVASISNAITEYVIKMGVA